MAEVEKEQTQDAFRAGLFVRALGRPCSANPYLPNSSEGLLWAKGWRLVDEHGENAPASGAISPNAPIPEFTAGVATAKARRDPLKPKPIIFPWIRFAEALRLLAVIAMIVFMLIALRI